MSCPHFLQGHLYFIYDSCDCTEWLKFSFHLLGPCSSILLLSSYWPLMNFLIYSHSVLFVFFFNQGYDSLIKKEFSKYFALLIAYYGYQGREEGTEAKLFCSVSICLANLYQYWKMFEGTLSLSIKDIWLFFFLMTVSKEST